MNKLIKIYLIEGHAYAYHLSKVYIIYYRIRQENTKFIVLLLEKNNVKVQNYSNYQTDLLILELIHLDGL